MSREMKDSGIEWIGGIPENWNVIRIHNIFQRRLEKNQPIKSKERLSLSIEKGVTLYSEKTTNLDRFKDDFTQYQIAYPNDIILNSMNMIVGAVGKSNYFGCVSPVYYVIYGRKDNNVDSEYYSYLLNIPTIRKIYYKLGQGIYAIDRGDGRVNTCRLKVNYVDFRNIVVPIPPISEQRKISTYINMKCGEVDSMIALQEEMISELQAYKQSVITEAVTHGLNPNVKMKDSGIEWIGEIPENWDIDKVLRIFNVISSGTTPKGEFYYEGNIPWINSGDLNNSDLYTCKKSVNELALKDYSVLKTYSIGTIIIAMYGASIGKMATIKFEGCTNQACCALSYLRKDCDRKYIFYHLLTCKRKWIEESFGGTQPNISAEKIKQTWLAIPPLPEQQAIATYLDSKCSDIDSLISLKQEKIESQKAYKQSIIYEYVTGKKEVS